MEQTPLPPLLSDEQILNDVKLTVRATPNRTMEVKDLPLMAFQVRDIYEADRAKTREVVQALVDALATCQTFGGKTWSEDSYDEVVVAAALSSAKSQLNIEPTKP